MNFTIILVKDVQVNLYLFFIQQNIYEKENDFFSVDIIYRFIVSRIKQDQYNINKKLNGHCEIIVKLKLLNSNPSQFLLN